MKRFLFVLKRFCSMIFILAVASVLIFFLLRLFGSDPLSVMIGSARATDELKQTLTERYSLDEPLFTQYLIWIKGVLSGDFGIDYIDGQDVRQLIAARLPITLGLVIMSSIISFIIAIIMGVTAALNRNEAVDTGLSAVMLIITGMPSFLVSIVTLIVITYWFPGVNFIGTYSNFGEYMQRITIPSCIMSLMPMAMLGRITRSSMIKQLQSPYIDTAKAKGIGERSVTYKHAFHNAVIPVITAGGYMVAASVGSTVIVEQVFSIPGIGGLLVTAIQQSNFPVIQILVLFMLTVYMVMSFIIDVLYTILDPRVELK